jgi:hypothetical protein
MTGHLLGAAGGIEAVAAIQVGVTIFLFYVYLSYAIVYELSFGFLTYITFCGFLKSSMLVYFCLKRSYSITMPWAADHITRY